MSCPERKMQNGISEPGGEGLKRRTTNVKGGVRKEKRRSGKKE